MAGAYCGYCDRRCFVYREITFRDGSTWQGHMATCAKGMEHDRQMTGFTHNEAYNPYETGVNP